MSDIEDTIRRIVREELSRAAPAKPDRPPNWWAHDCPCSPGIICGGTGCRRSMVQPCQPLQPYRVTD